jgi:hypothetical protein
MKNFLKVQSDKAIQPIRPFLSHSQFSVMVSACSGEEGDFFRQKFIDLEKLIASTPVTYEQDGKGDDAIVYLHYFFGGCDWYITEKDADGGVLQAFGYAVLFGDKQNAELGYICITEITKCGAELDLYFTPCPLAEIKLIKVAA